MKWLMSARLRRYGATLFLTLALATAGGPAAAAKSAAKKMVSIPSDAVNLRAGPGTKHDATMKVGRHYPLEVLKRQGEWLKVRDFEGDEGWVLASLTSKKPTMIAKRPGANIRKGPGTEHPVVKQTQYGQVFLVAEKRGRWIKVTLPDGKTRGWVDRSLLWGG